MTTPAAGAVGAAMSRSSGRTENSSKTMARIPPIVDRAADVYRARPRCEAPLGRGHPAIRPGAVIRPGTGRPDAGPGMRASARVDARGCQGVEQPLPERLRPSGELPLPAHVLGLARRGLDGHDTIAPTAQVVGG